MMFYLDNTMTTAPIIDVSRNRNIIDILKDVMRALKEEQANISYSALKDNILTINNGFVFNEDFSIYEISDGINIVYSKLKKIDSNNSLIIEDISSLNKNNITIKVPRLNITIEEKGKEEHFLFNREMKLIFQKTAANYFNVSNNAKTVQTVNITVGGGNAANGTGYFCFYNEHEIIFLCRNYSQTIPNLTVFIVSAGRNGFIEFFNGVTVSSSSFSNFRAINNDYEVSEAPSGMSQTGIFFGVTSYMSNDGYIFEKLLKVSGAPPSFNAEKPYLLTENIVLLKVADGKTIGLNYE